MQNSRNCSGYIIFVQRWKQKFNDEKIENQDMFYLNTIAFLTAGAQFAGVTFNQITIIMYK